MSAAKAFTSHKCVLVVAAHAAHHWLASYRTTQIAPTPRSAMTSLSPLPDPHRPYRYLCRLEILEDQHLLTERSSRLNTRFGHICWTIFFEALGRY